jgi:hypothetical protein
MSGLRISQLPSGIPSLSGIIPFTNDTKTETFQGVVEDFLNLQSLVNLSDVSTSGLTDGSFIMYSGGNWLPVSGSLGAGGAVSQANGTLINGSGNNYDPGTTADTVRISGINDAVLTGLSYTNYPNDAGLFVNVGSGNVTIRHLNVSSDAANRFSVPWAGDYVLSPSGGAALVLRDKTDNFWRIV